MNSECPQKLSDLDNHFRQSSLEGNWRWFSVNEMKIGGKGWNHTACHFSRLPAEFQNDVREVIWELSQHSAGIYIDFETEATSLAARWSLRFETSLAEQMPATTIGGLDLYGWNSGEWTWCATGQFNSFKQNESILLEGMEKSLHRFRLYLPLYNGIDRLEIGVPEGYSIDQASPLARQTYCIYGTSIVQGGCASRAGMSYPAILGRLTGAEIINLGFSGNARMEPELVNILAEVNANTFILDPLPNMSAHLIKERYLSFVQTLHKRRPDAELVLVEQLPRQSGWIRPDHAREVSEKNAILRTIYDNLKQTIPTCIRYVPGDGIIDNGDATTDGLHLNDIGFRKFARHLHQHLTID